MSRQGPQRTTLVEDYQPSRFKQKQPKKRKVDNDGDDDEIIVDTRAAKRILSLGRDLEEEDTSSSTQTVSHSHSAFDFNSAELRDQPTDDDEEPENEEAWQDEDFQDMEVDVNSLPAMSPWSDIGQEINPNDLETFNRFNPEAFDTFHGATLDSAAFGPEAGGSRNLADIILAKIAEQEGGKADVQDPEDTEPAKLPPKVVEVYSKCVVSASLLRQSDQDQSRRPPLPLQIRKAAQSLPDHAHPPARNAAGHPPPHPAGKVDTPRHPPGDPRLRRRQRLHRAVLPRRGPAGPRARGHLREQEAQRAPLLRAEEGAVQTRGLLQGRALPAPANLVHAARGHHRVQRAGPGQHPRAAQRRRPVEMLRHRRGADGRGRRRRGAGEPVHQDAPRQELRPALPDCRRARLPLPALPAGPEAGPRVWRARRRRGTAAGGVAPVPALVCAEVQKRHLRGAARGAA